MRLATCLVSVLTGFPLSRRREPPTSKDRETQDRPWVQDNLVKFCDNVRVGSLSGTWRAVSLPTGPGSRTHLGCDLRMRTEHYPAPIQDDGYRWRGGE
ncbi:hypothetical protein G6O67_004893 [Ophiocordyceps sinensis]|uniref:Uncharacterized protein n=1 Tax=Ophiocordyceps sinensis TaxID=72228 RepID=A0A8H4PQI5_9HYPO|nr:hypothetical protein G6O67_004893 [Ophiocordyceps sinensis]